MIVGKTGCVDTGDTTPSTAIATLMGGGTIVARVVELSGGVWWVLRVLRSHVVGTPSPIPVLSLAW